MSNSDVDSPLADSDQDKNKFDIKHNPNGPWANLDDRTIKDNIARLAAEHHAACKAENPALSEFPVFLDAFTTAWLEQKAQVDSEAQKYGFVPIESTATLTGENRTRAGILALTRNGSFVLLGNGCLVYHGGSGRYEKIPYRKGGASVKYFVPRCIKVKGEAELRQSLDISGDGPAFIRNTSGLHALYFTTRTLPADDELALGNVLSESAVNLRDTIADFDRGETIVDVPLPGRPTREDDVPGDVPEWEPEPEYEPAH
ncbi:MAG: hypothetical protein QF741_04800 [Candidatus Peribacteraceae bacterium]|nr:hypothetical protein [Candidatus Peribacteraceae bacterium]MDP7454816.1 hypothetical protein [Candidatus Peribacteraceae bacterium]MDP7645908.1 hypothetical protein [Candidatus Peribacteraceae bacterium]